MSEYGFEPRRDPGLNLHRPQVPVMWRPAEELHSANTPHQYSGCCQLRSRQQKICSRGVPRRARLRNPSVAADGRGRVIESERLPGSRQCPRQSFHGFQPTEGPNHGSLSTVPLPFSTEKKKTESEPSLADRVHRGRHLSADAVRRAACPAAVHDE